MHITEIRVQLLPRPIDKLCAFVRLTVEDALVVRDIKVIEGAAGRFVAMPSRKLLERCAACGGKNPVRSRFCATCGVRVAPTARAPEGARRYADVCHPINQAARASLEATVLEAYQAELARSLEPGYRPTQLDEFDYDDCALHAHDGAGR